MAEPENYGIIWQECGEDSDIARRFFVPGYKGFLPFFLYGEDLAAFDNKKSVELREEHLLKGILYGLYQFDQDPKPWKFWHRKENRNTLLYLLDFLGNRFNFETPEKMVLDVACDLREKNGNNASRIVLEVGAKLIPSSSKIKSDLICDLSTIASDHGGEHCLFEEIIDLFGRTDLDKILPEAKESICRGTLYAIRSLERDDEILPFLTKYIYPDPSMRELATEIKALLDNPDAFIPEKL
jgi:hypothetical protein